MQLHYNQSDDTDIDALSIRAQARLFSENCTEPSPSPIADPDEHLSRHHLKHSAISFLLLIPRRHGRRNQSSQCEDSLESYYRLPMLNSYVLLLSGSPRSCRKLVACSVLICAVCRAARFRYLVASVIGAARQMKFRCFRSTANMLVFFRLLGACLELRYPLGCYCGHEQRS